MVIETEHASESLTAPDRLAKRTGLSRGSQEPITESLVISLTVACTMYSASARSSERLPNKIIRPTHSSFTERTNRSAKAFKLGDLGGNRITLIPRRASIPRKASVYFVSRVHDQNLNVGQELLIDSVRLRAICAIH
jgi:hypothetical protein